MSQQFYDRPKSELDFGAVFSRAFGALSRHGLSLVALGIAFILLPQVAGAWLVSVRQGSPQETNLISVLIGATIGIVGRGALIHAGIAAMRSDRVSLRESALAGVRLFGPVWGLSWLVGMGVGLGTLLLIVPGIFLAVSWCIALPIRIDGGPGATEAISKSHEMTQGHRWVIFAIWLIVWIIPFAVMFGLAVALASVVGDQNPFYDLVVAPAWTMLQTIFTTLITASIYLGLSGGRAARATADVFS